MSAGFQVFICHNGPEVNLTVVDALDNMLRSRGITSFTDYEKESAAKSAIIKVSYVHVVFLTPEFASSKCCLEEVVEIMKTQRTANTPRKALLLPVFYDVEPCVVRYQLKESKYDLEEKMSNSTPEEREEWSKALNSLSYAWGFVYNTKTTRQTTKLMEIVSEVETFLKEVSSRSE